MRLLVLAQRQTDDVDVVPLEGAVQGGTPAAADVEQCHAWLEAQLAERQVDLGDLRLLERHVVALEVRAAVRLGRVEEEPEEVVGQVVVRLNVLEVGLQALGVADLVWQVCSLWRSMLSSGPRLDALEEPRPRTTAQFTHSTRRQRINRGALVAASSLRNARLLRSGNHW